MLPRSRSIDKLEAPKFTSEPPEINDEDAEFVIAAPFDSLRKITITFGGVSYELNANLDGKYKFGNDHDLAGYTLVYDVKGNGSNIKEFNLISN